MYRSYSAGVGDDDDLYGGFESRGVAVQEGEDM